MRTRILLLFWVVLGTAAESLKENVHPEDLNSDHERRNMDAALPSYLEVRDKRWQDLKDVELSPQKNARLNAHHAPVFVLDVDENGAKKVVKKDTDAIKTKTFDPDLTERKRQLENDNATLEQQVADLTAENQALQEDKVALEAEIYRLKVANAELAEKNATLEQENKNLLVQLSEANNALNDANRRLNILTAANVTLTAERNYLAAALRDTEDVFKDTENKLANAEAAFAALKSEMEQRLRQKDEEIESLRKSGQRAIEELEITLIEVEARYKSEIVGIKEKYATDIRELEVSLGYASEASVECVKQIKILQPWIKELEAALEDTRRQLDNALAELSLSALNTERANALLESAEQARKEAEDELADTYARLNEVTLQVIAFTNDKRRLESDIAVMQSDLDEALSAKIAAEERADRLQAELHILAEKLRQEQENAVHVM